MRIAPERARGRGACVARCGRADTRMPIFEARAKRAKMTVCDRIIV